jgi:hypothetical protein
MSVEAQSLSIAYRNEKEVKQDRLGWQALSESLANEPPVDPAEALSWNVTDSSGIDRLLSHSHESSLHSFSGVGLL